MILVCTISNKFTIIYKSNIFIYNIYNVHKVCTGYFKSNSVLMEYI